MNDAIQQALVGLPSALVGGVVGGFLAILASDRAVRRSAAAERELRLEERVEQRRDREAELARQDKLIADERAHLREEADSEWMAQRMLALAALSHELMMTSAAACTGRLEITLGAWVPVQDAAMTSAQPYLSTLPKEVLEPIKAARFLMWEYNALVEITNARGGDHRFQEKLKEEVPILAEFLTDASKAIYEYIRADLGIREPLPSD